MAEHLEVDGKNLIIGTVVRAGGGFYEVDAPEANAPEANAPEANAPDEDERSGNLLCQVRGKLKHGKRSTAQPVVVGDQVRVRLLATFGANSRGQRLREGYVEEVLPRRSWLGRSRGTKTDHVTVANLDRVVVVMSLREPELNTHRLDRFLVLAEANDLEAIICLNKFDLLKKREVKKEVEPIQQLYGGLGYRVLPVSAETDYGIDELRDLISGHVTAFLGSSGVGKSSLANAVQPGLHLWVGDVMDIGKGRHTTTEVSLHRLDGGGYVVDTPGIKTVSLLEREEVNLPQCFPEFLPLNNECRFNNCSHDHEPGCAVRQAVEAGEIDAGRYESYKKILADSKSAQPVYAR
jgi:ribosome biogenesis GTPase